MADAVPPLGYRGECVPRTLAALAGIDLEEAARILWPLRAMWGSGGPRGGDGGWGTPQNALIDALVRFGFGVEWWTGRGEFIADAWVMRRLVGRWAHKRVVTVRRHRCGAAGGAALEEEGFPLREWLERMQVGTWVYTVVPPGPGRSHAAAFRGPRVLSDPSSALDKYIDWRVDDVLRVLRPA